MGYSADTRAELLRPSIENHFNIEDIVCDKLKTRKNATQSSLKIEVNEKDATDFMNPAKWPKGIFFNHFLNL